MSGLRVAARTKPVIVLKAGRHERGSQAASTHTGALIGSDDVFDAALERAGVVRAMTFGQLFAAAEILSDTPACRAATASPSSPMAAAPACSPPIAPATSASRLPISHPATVAKLDELLPAYWSHGNPVDILGDARPEVYGTAVTACLADTNVDGVLAMLTPQAMTDPNAAAEAIIAATRDQQAQAGARLLHGRGAGRRGARASVEQAEFPISPRPSGRSRPFPILPASACNQELAAPDPRSVFR